MVADDDAAVRTVLVTGGAGFIGQPLVRELIARGLRVRVLDSLRRDVHRDLPPGPPPATVAGAPLIVGDVRDPAAVGRALAGVDAVCHLAAKVGLGVDLRDLPDYTDSNVTGTAVLLAAMDAAGVRRLALASSMVIYGEGLARCAVDGPVPPAPRLAADLAAGGFESRCPRCGRTLGAELVDEDAPVDPRNGYAVTKLAQEQLAGAWARSSGGVLTALRYHNVYGPGLPRDTPYAGVAAIFLSALAAGRAPRVYEDGGQRRDFVHVRDVARATATGLLRPARAGSADAVRAFNVGSGSPRTVGEMARALAAATGGPEPVVTGQFRLGDVRHITADSTRLRRELRWAPIEAFDVGMRELAAAGPPPRDGFVGAPAARLVGADAAPGGAA
jgi:dTDP-L-rhamnose 4-epimerase